MKLGLKKQSIANNPFSKTMLIVLTVGRIEVKIMGLYDVFGRDRKSFFQGKIFKNKKLHLYGSSKVDHHYKATIPYL